MFASTLAFGFDQVRKGIHCKFGVSLSHCLWFKDTAFQWFIANFILLPQSKKIMHMILFYYTGLHDIIAFLVHKECVEGEERYKRFHGHFLCLFDTFGASFLGSSGSSIAMNIEDQAPEFYNIIIYV
ncbi:hypothetical protein ACJX0J_025072, partial [Zea mays]